MAHDWVNALAKEILRTREAARIEGEHTASETAERKKLVDQLWERMRSQTQLVAREVNDALPDLSAIEFVNEPYSDPAHIVLSWNLDIKAELSITRPAFGDRQIVIATTTDAARRGGTTNITEQCDIVIKAGTATLVHDGREVGDVVEEFIRPWLQQIAKRKE